LVYLAHLTLRQYRFLFLDTNVATYADRPSSSDGANFQNTLILTCEGYVPGNSTMSTISIAATTSPSSSPLPSPSSSSLSASSSSPIVSSSPAPTSSVCSYLDMPGCEPYIGSFSDSCQRESPNSKSCMSGLQIHCTHAITIGTLIRSTNTIYTADERVTQCHNYTLCITVDFHTDSGFPSCSLYSVVKQYDDGVNRDAFVKLCKNRAPAASALSPSPSPNP
jgi:hypothetical protein